MSEKSPVSSQTSLIPWVLVACLALVAALATRLYVAARAEAASERLQASLADLESRSARNQLEAEQILSRRQIEDLSRELKQANQRIRELGGDAKPQGASSNP
jgi:predicted  nucleic acid-binding Zn-ribbon protein